MGVTRFSIHHATAVFVLIFCMIVGGLMSYLTLPKEAAPDIAIPIVIVSTPYFGVSPTDIETLVTQPIEKEFKSLRGVKKMTSTSAESVSLVTVEFETDVDIDQALDKVREKVDEVKPELPPDAEDPQVIEVNASDFPIMIANISGDMDLARLKQIAEDIKDDIEKVPGVLRVDLSGGVEREIQIRVDPDKLRRYKVSVNQVIGALQAENINLPGGSVEIGSMKYLLRIPGEFEDMDTMRELVVKAPEGQAILLRDVAEVVDTFKEPETYSRLSTWVTGPDGSRKLVTQPSVSLSVIKRAGENLLEISDAAKDIVAEYEQGSTSSVKVAILNDSSIFIRSTVRDLENNIISGMLLVLGVLFFFMGGARNALMVAISVPLSMLLTFVVLSVLGITLNMVVLFSLILALGMLVDNAIVIVENIYRHASEGKPIKQAALEGTEEVGWAIIASTMTTVGAFFPMTFWPGVTGEFMSYLPMTVIITLLASLFIALIINPTVASVFLKVRRDGGLNTSEYEVPDNAVYRAYRSTLEWSLNHRIVVMVLSLGALFGTFAVFANNNNGVEFFPETAPELFTIKFELADGTRLDETDGTMALVSDPLDGKIDLIGGLTPAELEKVNKPLADGALDVEAWIEDVGTKSGGPGGAGGGNAPHYGTVSVDLKAAAEQGYDPLVFMDRLRDVYAAVPGANIVIEKQSSGPPSGKAVNIEIVGEDMREMARVARMIKDDIAKIPGIIDLDDDVELSRPEIVVIVDRKRAAMLKLDTRSIASTVRTAINGQKATVFREGDEEYDITVRLPQQMRKAVEDVGSLTISNRDGDRVPLKEVAEVEIQSGSGSIRHKNQDRIVSVSANAASGYLPADLLAQVQERVAKLEIPSGYDVRYAGENEDQAEAGAFLGNALLAAVFIIAMILVTQFNSIVQPFIILASVLLSLIGALWALILFGEPFGIIMTGIGIISLAGVVVNNSIVLIDYTNKLRERGLSRREALVVAGLVRFRPVLLTAVTTVLGLVPLVVGVSIDFVAQEVVYGGQSVDLWGPMAKVVSSGLLVATVLTLIVVPVMYSALDAFSEWFRGLFGGGGDAPTPPEGGEPGPDAEPDEGPAVAGADGTANGSGAAAGAVALIAALGLGGLIGLAPAPAAAQQPPAEELPAAGDDSEEAEFVPPGEEFSRPGDVKVDGEYVTRVNVDLEAARIKATRELTLEQARAAVGESNFDLRIAMTNVAAAKSTTRKAFSTLVPTFLMRFAGTLYDEQIEADFGLPPIPGAPDTGPIIIRPQFDYNFVVSASLRISPQAWPLLQQAWMNEELSELQVAAITEELEFGVVQTYYNLLLAKQFVAIANEQVASDRTNLEATERRAAAGVARPFELTRAKLRIAQSEQQLEQARLGFIQVREALAQILQQPSDFDVVDPGVVEVPKNLDELKSKAREERASIAAQRKGQELAAKAREEIYWKYLPNMEVTAQGFRPRETAFSPGRFQWSLGLTATWIVWDGGLREAELDERGARLLAAKLQREQAESKIDSDIDLAWSEYRSQLSSRAVSRAQIDLAREGVEESRKAYNLGAATQLDVIFSEDQLRMAELAILQDELRVQLSVRKLRYLAGLE
jgi:multidrug efflux pump subunit AcrB/outer membrane protein TolC